MTFTFVKLIHPFWCNPDYILPTKETPFLYKFIKTSISLPISSSITFCHLPPPPLPFALRLRPLVSVLRLRPLVSVLRPPPLPLPPPSTSPHWSPSSVLHPRQQVRATMENGVLTVVVPKEEEKQPQIKSIEISG